MRRLGQIQTHAYTLSDGIENVIEAFNNQKQDNSSMQLKQIIHSAVKSPLDDTVYFNVVLVFEYEEFDRSIERPKYIGMVVTN